LGLLPGQLTPRLQEGLVRLSTQIPSFAKAVGEFAFWTHLEVHRTTAARITEAAGATAVARQTAEATRILTTHPPPPPGPEQLVFSVDGAMVPLVHGQWAEARTLAVGEPVMRTNAAGEPAVQTTALSYFSRLTDSTTFGELATAELHRRGVETAGRGGVVVDGAAWCQTCIDLHTPHAVRILDFPHAASYVEAIGQTVGREGPLLDAPTRTSLCHDLKHDGPDTVLMRLRTTVEAAGGLGETRTQLAYLETRRDQMDYPQFQAAQWPIASGSVESANKLVVEERLKGAGMHWAEANVNPLLALRNALYSDRWGEVWTQIEDAQRQAERVRRRDRQQRRAAPPPAGVRPSADAPTRRPRATPARSDSVTPVTQPAPTAEVNGRPAADHPWRKPWSLRRQREIASTA